MMELAAVVTRYLERTGGFDLPLGLSELGLQKTDLERLFSTWDEDYQISRFMLLSREEGPDRSPQTAPTFSINGYDYTQVTFRSGIQQILASG